MIYALSDKPVGQPRKENNMKNDILTVEDQRDEAIFYLRGISELLLAAYIAGERDGESCGHGLELLHKISWDLVQRLEAAE